MTETITDIEKDDVTLLLPQGRTTVGNKEKEVKKRNECWSKV